MKFFVVNENEKVVAGAFDTYDLAELYVDEHMPEMALDQSLEVVQDEEVDQIGGSND